MSRKELYNAKRRMTNIRSIKNSSMKRKSIRVRYKYYCKKMSIRCSAMQCSKIPRPARPINILAKLKEYDSNYCSIWGKFGHIVTRNMKMRESFGKYHYMDDMIQLR